MQKINLIILVAITFSLNCFADNGFKYQVEGNIHGLKNDSVIFFIRDHDKNGIIKADTIITVAKNDRFFLKGTSTGIRDVYVVLGGMKARKNFSLFLEEGTIKIEGNIDSTDKISVKGTPGNNDYTERKQIENELYQSIRSLQSQLKDIKNKKDSQEAITGMSALRDSISSGRIRFIRSHPNSPASAIYLYVLQDNIPVEQLETLYNSFSTDVKGSSFVIKIPEKIRARKRSAIGQPAPDFSVVDIKGKAVNLASFKGKYVLLEFWASWCVPCRAQNPNLVKAYEKFKNKGFDIIGISLDDKKEKWEEAIQKDGLPWIHVSDLNAFDNKIARLYGVQPIPDNFLIDPQGKIIARRLEDDQLERKLNGLVK